MDKLKHGGWKCLGMTGGAGAPWSEGRGLNEAVPRANRDPLWVLTASECLGTPNLAGGGGCSITHSPGTAPARRGASARAPVSHCQRGSGLLGPPVTFPANSRSHRARQLLCCSLGSSSCCRLTSSSGSLGILLSLLFTTGHGFKSCSLRG